MRIAFIFDALLYGGIERVGISYLRLLAEDGHDIDVYILNPDDIQDIITEIPASCRIYKKKVSQYICPARYWYVAKRWSWGKFAFPIAYSIAYIVLQIYGIWFRLRGKYDLAISMAGHFNDLSVNAYNLIRSKKKMCWLHGALYEYIIISPGFERLYMKIKNLVTLNDLSENLCLFYNKFLRFNLRKIYNPCTILQREIDIDKVNKLKNTYGDFILMVGRITSPKNQLCLIKSIEYIYHKYHCQYNIVFVGDGDMMPTLQQYASNSALKDFIHFVGNESEPQNYYKAAKIFAFSSFSEGMPTVIIEAMNFGLPIVTTDTSVREILRNGEDGLISPIDDDKALGENIHKMMQDKTLWKLYSQKSLQRAQAFSPQEIKKRLNSYIASL